MDVNWANIPAGRNVMLLLPIFLKMVKWFLPSVLNTKLTNNSVVINSNTSSTIGHCRRKYENTITRQVSFIPTDLWWTPSRWKCLRRGWLSGCDLCHWTKKNAGFDSPKNIWHTQKKNKWKKEKKRKGQAAVVDIATSRWHDVWKTHHNFVHNDGVRPNWELQVNIRNVYVQPISFSYRMAAFDAIGWKMAAGRLWNRLLNRKLWKGRIDVVVWENKKSDVNFLFTLTFQKWMDGGKTLEHDVVRNKRLVTFFSWSLK